MRKIHLSVVVLCGILIQITNIAFGQSIPLDDYYRRNQLLGKIDSNISFTVRPVSPSAASEDVIFNDMTIPDSANRKAVAQNKFAVWLLPLTWDQQYNTHHPYGWNDGAMIRAKGYQTMISAGISAQAGFLKIQLRPEYVFAENQSFTTFQTDNNYIDRPERYGNGAYTKLSWGQSNVRLNLGPVSLGLSNENLWWGPGIRNSLLMTNSATGFKHLTLNTTRPVSTPIGSIEGQIVAGRLEASGFAASKPDQWRYLSAVVLSYQPKWVPGLFVGFSRVFQTYHTELKSFSDYMPLFRPFQKINDKNNSTGVDDNDQLASVFARWFFREAKTEVYFEYGKNDHSLNQRDFLLSPEHSRAYMAGMRKILPFKNRSDEHLQVSLEFTHLQQSIDRSLRDAGPWYLHYLIISGYTHQGEVLGAGIGPGSNLQSFDVSWIKGVKHIGLQFERYVHNNDFFYANLNNSQHGRWTDLSLSSTGVWDYKNLIFNAKVQAIKSLNYQWQVKQYGSDVLYTSGNNVFNLHARIGISYRFKGNVKY